MSTEIKDAIDTLRSASAVVQKCAAVTEDADRRAKEAQAALFEAEGLERKAQGELLALVRADATKTVKG